MYEVEYVNKPFTTIWDDAKEFKDTWVFTYFDTWHVFPKESIKSVTKIKQNMSKELIIAIVLVGSITAWNCFKLYCRYVGNNKEDDNDLDKDWWV